SRLPYLMILCLALLGIKRIFCLCSWNERIQVVGRAVSTGKWTFLRALESVDAAIAGATITPMQPSSATAAPANTSDKAQSAIPATRMAADTPPTIQLLSL